MKKSRSHRGFLFLVFSCQAEYHICRNKRFGKTQGYYGPYIWQDTVPTVYRVELPGGTAEYTVNILKGFVFRSWMDYLTFGRYGTSGWASPDGTINCVEQAYDFDSERFLVSLLKHEAQHTVDMKHFPDMTTAELEYRAKLVELHYSNDSSLSECLRHSLLRLGKKKRQNDISKNSKHTRIHNLAAVCCFAVYTLFLNVI